MIEISFSTDQLKKLLNDIKQLQKIRDFFHGNREFNVKYAKVFNRNTIYLVNEYVATAQLLCFIENYKSSNRKSIFRKPFPDDQKFHIKMQDKGKADK